MESKQLESIAAAAIMAGALDADVAALAAEEASSAAFLALGKFDILRRLGTYRRVVPISYNTAVPAEFLFL